MNFDSSFAYKTKRLTTSTGYRDSLGLHVYVRDWQGNIRAVVRKDADGNAVLEQAAYYYPYGMPMAESTNPTANPNKYTGKELITDQGFNAYDYEARLYDPATCIWLSVDEKSNIFSSYSHYAFCKADPINYKDPNGKWFIKVSASEDRGAHPYATYRVYNTNGGLIYKTIVRVTGNGRDRTQENNDTPCGIYQLNEWRETGNLRYPVESYGPNPLLAQIYISGEAAEYGRQGMHSHGGRQQEPELTSTYGCIRIADEDIKELKTITDNLPNQNPEENMETLVVENDLDTPVDYQNRVEYKNEPEILINLPELIVTPK